MLSWCVSGGYKHVYAGNWGLVLGGAEWSDLCYGHIYPLRKKPQYPFMTTPALKDMAVKRKIPAPFWESNPGFPDSSVSPHWQYYHKFCKFKMISIWCCELHSYNVPFLSHLEKIWFQFCCLFPALFNRYSVIIWELVAVWSASNSTMYEKLSGNCTVYTIGYMVSGGGICVNDELEIMRKKQIMTSFVPRNLVGLRKVKWTLPWTYAPNFQIYSSKLKFQT